MAINYASEKFSSVIYSIVTSAVVESPQDRVYSAALGTHTLCREDFTPELWMRFERFQSVVTRIPNEKEGSFRASANALSDLEAHDLLVEFYSLAQDVEEEYRSTFASKA